MASEEKRAWEVYVFDPDTLSHPAIHIAITPGPRIVITHDGHVRLEGFATPDAAARAFWQAVARLAPPGWRLEVPQEWGET